MEEERKKKHKYVAEDAKKLDHAPALQQELKTFRPHFYFKLIPKVSVAK